MDKSNIQLTAINANNYEIFDVINNDIKTTLTTSTTTSTVNPVKKSYINKINNNYINDVNLTIKSNATQPLPPPPTTTTTTTINTTNTNVLPLKSLSTTTSTDTKLNNLNNTTIVSTVNETDKQNLDSEDLIDEKILYEAAELTWKMFATRIQRKRASMLRKLNAQQPAQLLKQQKQVQQQQNNLHNDIIVTKYMQDNGLTELNMNSINQNHQKIDGLNQQQQQISRNNDNILLNKNISDSNADVTTNRNSVTSAMQQQISRASNPSVQLNRQNPIKRRDGQGEIMPFKRWDPKYLKYLRKLYCIPVIIIMLLTSFSITLTTGWINANNNAQRGGYFRVCNYTYYSVENSSVIVDPRYNESIVHEHCYLGFIFKEGLLLLLVIRCIALLMYIITIILLYYSMMQIHSVRKRYLYHSAGEFMAALAILTSIELFSFRHLARTQFEDNYNLGICFYIYSVMIIFAISCSVILNLDDFAKDYQLALLNLEKHPRRKR